MPGRAASRRASARIRLALNSDVKLESKDEPVEKEPTYEQEEGQTELDEAPANDWSTRQGKGPKGRQNGTNVNRKCSTCDRPPKRLRRGMCDPCYKRLFLKPKKKLDKRVCTDCKQLKPRCAKGICATCYSHIVRKTIKCRLCCETKSHYARGLCEKCYRKERPMVECRLCGETKIHQAHGLCKNCYQKEFDPRKMVVCTSCRETKRHGGYGLCRVCYSRAKRKNKENNTKIGAKAGPSSNVAAQDTPNDDVIELSSASENETDVELSSGEESENYDVKPRVKKEETTLSSGDEGDTYGAGVNVKEETMLSSGDEEETYDDESIKQEIKQEL